MRASLPHVRIRGVVAPRIRRPHLDIAFSELGLEGKAFPCGRAIVSADPFCGDTPQRPESESADGVSVTG